MTGVKKYRCVENLAEYHLRNSIEFTIEVCRYSRKYGLMYYVEKRNTSIFQFMDRKTLRLQRRLNKELGVHKINKDNVRERHSAKDSDKTPKARVDGYQNDSSKHDRVPRPSCVK